MHLNLRELRKSGPRLEGSNVTQVTLKGGAWTVPELLWVRVKLWKNCETLHVNSLSLTL